MGRPIYSVEGCIKGQLVSGFGAGEDGLHLRSGSVRNCFIRPTPNIALTEAHLDGVQVIPGSGNSQYALAEIPVAVISGNVVDGKTTPVQCIFCSDGIIAYASIQHNILRTDGQHLITFNGLLSADIYYNEFDGPAKFPMKFYPARAGGRPKGRNNVWILSFKDNYYQYNTIQTDRPDLVQDYRQTVFNDTDTFLVDFDVVSFRRDCTHVPPGKGQIMGAAFQDIAMQYGHITKEHIT